MHRIHEFLSIAKSELLATSQFPATSRRSRKAPGKPKKKRFMFKYIPPFRVKNCQTRPQNRVHLGAPKSGTPLNILSMERAKSGTHSGVPVLALIALSQRAFSTVSGAVRIPSEGIRPSLARTCINLRRACHVAERGAACKSIHFNTRPRQSPWPRGATPYNDATYLLSGDKTPTTTRTSRCKHMLEQKITSPGGGCNTSA